MNSSAGPSWAEMMTEARTLIPGLDSRWTDHNASDPGIILIEMLAWLHEMLLYRLEEVPAESVAAFLALLTGAAPPPGMELEEATAGALRQMRRIERAVTPDDYRTLLQRHWAEVAPGYEPLSRIDLHSPRDLEDPAAPSTPGHHTAVLSPRAVSRSLAAEVCGNGLTWSFETATPGRIELRPTLPVRQELELSLVSPRGAKALEFRLPATVPVVSLDGSAGTLRAPAFEWAAGGAVTVELLLRLEEYGSSATNLLSVGTPSDTGRFLIRGPDAAGALTFEYGRIEAGGGLGFDLRPVPGEWVHLAFVSSSTGQWIYVNGELASGSMVAVDPPTGSLSGLIVGKGLRGMVAELRLWRAARDGEAIARDRFSRLRGNEPGLVGYWPLNEETGIAAGSSVPGAGALELSTGAAWTAADAPVYPSIVHDVTDWDLLTGKRWSLHLRNVDAGWASGTLRLSWPGASLKQGFCIPARQEIPRLVRWLVAARRPVLSFPGGKAAVTVAALDGSPLTRDLTIELWVRPRSVDSAAGLVCKARSGELDLTMLTGGKLVFRYGSGGNDTTTGSKLAKSTTGLEPGRWQHVAVVRRTGYGGAVVSFYIDGRPAGSSSVTLAAGSTTTLPLRIGTGSVGSFTGELAELRIWTVARPAAELLRHQAVSIRADQPGLYATWPMDEGEGIQIIDGCLASLRGELAGATWTLLRQGDGPPPPPTVPCVQDAPCFSGAVLVFDHLTTGTLEVELGSSAGHLLLGGALLDPGGQVRLGDEGTSPRFLCHRIDEDDPAPRQAWSLPIFCLSGQSVRLEGSIERRLEVDRLTRARVKTEILDPGRLLTTRHHVVNPRWVPCSIAACLFLLDSVAPVDVRRRAMRALRERFHPLSGGPDGTGWPIGRGLYWTDVYAVLERVEGVDYVVGGAWPEPGAPYDPSGTLTVHTEDASSRYDLEGSQVIGFRLEPYEQATVRGIVLTTARRRGDTWHPIA